MALSRSIWFRFPLVFLLLPSSAVGQRQSVLHRFGGSLDGAYPQAGLLVDAKGNLYGTTLTGGSGSGSCPSGCGTVFELTPPVPPNDSWTENVLYSFQGGDDGCTPAGGLVSDLQGNLYGVTQACGGEYAAGTVYQLAPPTAEGGVWTENVIYVFSSLDGSQGGQPVGTLVIDPKGNLYGVTEYGGAFYGGGVAFELSPPAGAGPWTETILQDFSGAAEGYMPMAGLIADKAGNLYGTAFYGGTGPCSDGGPPLGCGIAFELSPPSQAGQPWVEAILHEFGTRIDDGIGPESPLCMDQKGNLYGTAPESTSFPGMVFELSPLPSAGGWTETILHSFTAFPDDGAQPYAGVVVDKVGRVYGTTLQGGVYCFYTGCGVVFELTPPSTSGGTWVESLYSFDGLDGDTPWGNLIIFEGKLYGTTGGCFGPQVGPFFPTSCDGLVFSLSR